MNKKPLTAKEIAKELERRDRPLENPPPWDDSYEYDGDWTYPDEEQ